MAHKQNVTSPMPDLGLSEEPVARQSESNQVGSLVQRREEGGGGGRRGRGGGGGGR